MKYKKRRNPRPEPKPKTSNPAWERIKERFRRIDRREVMKTGLWFLGAALLYAVCNHFELLFHLYAYPIAAGLIGAAYLVLNGGTFAKNVEFNRERLPKDWSDEQKAEAEAKFFRNRTWARNLIPPLFALLMTLFVDLIYLNWVLL